MENSVVHELKRQSIHCVGIIAVLGSYVVPSIIILAGLAIACVTSATACFCRPVAQRIPFVRNLSDFVHSFAREDEVKKKIYIGATTFFLGLLIPALLFRSLLIFRASALVLILGDSFSTVVGKSIGRHKLTYNRNKSFEGFLAGLAASFVGTAFILPIPIAFAISFIGMLVESLPWNVNDNLSIPIITSIALWLLIMSLL